MNGALKNIGWEKHDGFWWKDGVKGKPVNGFVFDDVTVSCDPAIFMDASVILMKASDRIRCRVVPPGPPRFVDRGPSENSSGFRKCRYTWIGWVIFFGCMVMAFWKG
jgi:hypothetical protein